MVRKVEIIKVSGNSDAWARSLSSIFVELEVRQLDPERPMWARFFRYPFGDLTFIRAVTRGGPHRAIRTARLIEQSTRNNFFICALLMGEATLSQETHRAELHKGDIAILDSTLEYSIDIHKSFDGLFITVPRYRLDGRLNSISNIVAQRIDGSEGIGHVTSSLLRVALEEAPRIHANEATRISNHILDLISLGLQRPENINESDRRTIYHKAILRRIQEYIESRLDDEELSPQSIAQANSISVRYLNKLFNYEGTSTARWIRMRRLERCRIDLENIKYSKKSISDIAYNHGFKNISSFNRTFRQYYNMSPKMLRDKY